MDQTSEPLAILRISPLRRWLAVGVQAGLGVLLIFLAFDLPDAGGLARGILAAIGGLALWQAISVWQATARDVVLTRAGLFDTSGAAIAPLDRIAAVERGVFAFKPSNGFLVRLTEPMPTVWVPGVWWRYGTRVGIGGTASGRAAREMADVTLLLHSGQLDAD